jgi:AraC family transcriptional regulator, regulatory protein of adaptative response / DNA-3-methyladenine glycosylase II
MVRKKKNASAPPRAGTFDRSAELAGQYRPANAGVTRYDGHFIASVRSAGICCRLLCPARTQQLRNLEFLITVAAAQRDGYRACKRCRPDYTAGSLRRGLRDELTGRAMALIDAGALAHIGPRDLAGRLGDLSETLESTLLERVGAGRSDPGVAVAARTARTLVESSDLTISQIQTAAGFTSRRSLEEALARVYPASATRDTR